MLNLPTNLSFESGRLSSGITGRLCPEYSAYQQQYQAKITLQKEIHQAREQLNELVAKHWEQHFKSYRDIKSRNNRIKIDIDNIKRDIQQRENRINGIQKDIAANEQARDKLREDWHNEQSRQFNVKDMACPTCNRPYESGKAEEMREAFNLAKVANIAKIAERGKTLKSLYDDLINQAEILQEQVKQMREIIQGLENEIQPAEEPEFDHEELPGYHEAKEMLNQLEAEYKKPIPQPDIAELKRQKIQLQSVISGLKATLAMKDQIERGNNRIKDLEQEQKALSQELATLEKADFIMQNFEKAKATAIEENVSSRFCLVKWRLFEKQINGQEIPTCKATYKNVPYADLNSAAKANIGMDIINTLSKYYGVTAPIFIDNREGINQLIKTPSQLINLCVSKDPELVIETLTA